MKRLFALAKKACTLQHINIRDEKHGEENVLAIDIKLVGDFTGDILAEFGADLRHSLYKRAEGGDLADQASDMPTRLRFPSLCQPLKFSDEITGATVRVAYGLGDIALELCKVNEFRVECHEGGTVRVSYRVQARPVNDQLTLLSKMLGGDVDVTIEPPTAANDSQGSLLDEAA